jgi:ectoine hydroxylase-related dioxygenase (phytanoyl-CoA dioxygenase family)
LDRDGHVVIRGALDEATLRPARQAARVEIERAVASAAATGQRRPADYLSALDLAGRSAALGAVVRAPRLARAAAEALGVRSVRLLYDQLFAKPPGAICTVWHQDQVYWPVDTSQVVDEGRVGVARAWVSLTSVPAEVGGLHFVDGSHHFGPVDPADVEVVAPGRRATATILGRELSITDYGALEAGDATIHAGYTLHAARENSTDRTRYAVAVTYVPDGTRVAEPTDELQELAIAMHIPGRRAGDLVDGEANPVLWPVAAP